MVGADRAQQARGDAQLRPSPRRRAAEAHPRRRGRLHRGLPAGHARALEPRPGRPPRGQPRPRHRQDERLRADGPVQLPAGLRDARRVDLGLRLHQRLAGRPADAAAVRSRRRGRVPHRNVRRDVRAVVARARRRGSWPGDRPRHLRAALLDPRPPGARLRPARHRPGANRQRGAVRGAPQRLPGEGRPLARALGQRPVDRRAGDEDRRPRGSGRGAMVSQSRRPGRARRRARRDHPGVDRAPHDGGGAGGIRRARGRDRARQLDRRHPRRPSVRGAATR